jgi:hypothetical protein
VKEMVDEVWYRYPAHGDCRLDPLTREKINVRGNGFRRRLKTGHDVVL